jgi:hypothetical protein
MEKMEGQMGNKAEEDNNEEVGMVCSSQLESESDIHLNPSPEGCNCPDQASHHVLKLATSYL